MMLILCYFLQELYSHIEKGLGKNLKARCSALLLDSIEEYKKEMRGSEIVSMHSIDYFSWKIFARIYHKPYFWACYQVPVEA